MSIWDVGAAVISVAAGAAAAASSRPLIIGDSQRFTKAKCLAGGIITTASLLAWRWLNRPYRRVHPATVPRQSRGQRAKEFPPPFPNGWFVVARSAEVLPGQVVEINVLGHHLVLFRGRQSKQVAVMDAYCPHLGANLAVGGTVSGDCIRCPFHGWEFGLDGRLEKVANCPSLPDARATTWPTCEVNDVIFVWHDAEGRAPEWETEPNPVNCGVLRGFTESIIHAHIQEIPENGADVAHLNVLHTDFAFPSFTWAMHHGWFASWAPSAKAKHKTDITVRQRMLLNWRNYQLPFPLADVTVAINQIGPGIVRLIFDTPFGKVIVHEYITPRAPTTVMATHVMHSERKVPGFICRIMLSALDAQFRRDAPIWETKKYESRPVLSGADGPISAFRRWYSQFYSTSSMSFADAVAASHMLDW